MTMKKRKSAGFTLIEIFVVIGILGFLSRIVVISFSKFGTAQALDKATLTVNSVLNEAHSNAISSKGTGAYGVRIGKNKITSFSGSYGTNNTDYTISSLVNIATSTGIGADIIFQRVTGATVSSGTISMSLVSNASTTNVIQVFSTGIIQKN